MDPEREKGKREKEEKKSDRFFFLWKKETSAKKRTGKIKGREKVQQWSANVTLLIRKKRRRCYMSQRDLACRREREEERHEENRWSLKTEMRKKNGCRPRTTTRHERRDSFVDLWASIDETMPRIGRNDDQYLHGTL